MPTRADAWELLSRPRFDDLFWNTTRLLIGGVALSVVLGVGWAWLVMRTDDGPFPMETTYTWTAVGAAQTRMTLRNRGEPAGFTRVAAPMMASAMRRANMKDLARLKQILDS